MLRIVAGMYPGPPIERILFDPFTRYEGPFQRNSCRLLWHVSSY